MISIRVVQSPEDWKKFLNLPWEIYKNTPQWIPPLRLKLKETFDLNKNYYYRHAIVHPVLALDGDRVVGRVLGAIDRQYNHFHESTEAFFGFFECENNSEAAKKLTQEIQKWARGWGMTKLTGPIGLNTNYESGLLVEGFELEPTIDMPYHQPYYQDLLTSQGLVKVKDLYAFQGNTSLQFSQSLWARAEKLRQSSNIHFRPLNMRQYEEDLAIIQDIYRDGWERNWGFAPIGPEEFQQLAQGFKAVVDPRLVLIVEMQGKPVGFGVALPDINQIIKKIPDGRLWPTGWAKLLWYLKGPMRPKVVNRLRIITLGIKREYQKFAIGPLLYTEYYKLGRELGYPEGEASWILEDNRPMVRALERMNFTRSQVYRIFGMDI